MKKDELRTLVKNSLSKIEIEMQNKTGKFVTTGESSITDILMDVYGENIFKTFETFYKEFIND